MCFSDQANQPKSLRTVLLHQARSSKPAGSNSKLLNRRLEWDSFPAFLGSQKARLHPFGPQEVRGFPLGFYLMPKLNRHDDGCWLTTLVGNDLDFRARHITILLSPQSGSASRTATTSPTTYCFPLFSAAFTGFTSVPSLRSPGLGTMVSPS